MQTDAEPHISHVDTVGQPLPRNDLSQTVVAVESPCIIRNLENGLKSLGGEAQLRSVLQSRDDEGPKPASDKSAICAVSLRPHDPFAKKIPSVVVPTRNLLIRICMPRWTGRKRKRGSEGPFVEASKYDLDAATAPALLRRLNDCKDACHVQPVAVIRETHRFRSLPDLQLRSGDLDIMREIRDHAMNADYDQLRLFNVDLTPKISNATEYPGPPQFWSNDQPYPYNYQQAVGVVYKTGQDGEKVSINTMALQRRAVEAVATDVAVVPHAAPEDLNKRRFNPVTSHVIQKVQELLETRPLVSKWVLLQAIPEYTEGAIKEATQWTGYSFKNGPFRDLHIKYGIDPRSDPQFRKYQALGFQIDAEPLTQSAVALSDEPDMTSEARVYPFDGIHLSRKGKTWQVCDITDVILKELFDSAPVRDECELTQWGWYSHSTIIKARAIMKDKIKRIQANDALLSAAQYRPLLYLPDEYDAAARMAPLLDESAHDKAIIQLAADIRRHIYWCSNALRVKHESSDGRHAGDAGPRSTSRDDAVDPDDVIGLRDGEGDFDEDVD